MDTEGLFSVQSGDFICKSNSKQVLFRTYYIKIPAWISQVAGLVKLKCNNGIRYVSYLPPVG